MIVSLVIYRDRPVDTPFETFVYRLFTVSSTSLIPPFDVQYAQGGVCLRRSLVELVPTTDNGRFESPRIGSRFSQSVPF
jgi:hypothetical protein